jgi:hypothetical protein
LEERSSPRRNCFVYPPTVLYLGGALVREEFCFLGSHFLLTVAHRRAIYSNSEIEISLP